MLTDVRILRKGVRQAGIVKHQPFLAPQDVVDQRDWHTTFIERCALQNRHISLLDRSGGFDHPAAVALQDQITTLRAPAF